LRQLQQAWWMKKTQLIWSYNVILTTPKANIIVKPIVLIIIAKTSLTYTNCGKTCHTFETYHNKIIEVPIIPTTIVKSIEHVVKTKIQIAKLAIIPIYYPCIIYFNEEHRYG